MLNRTEAEWDALQDAIGTLWGLEPGHVLSEDDVAGLRLMDTCHREDEEAATDAYHRGLEDGLRQQGGDALVEAERRATRYLVEKSTERAMRRFAEALTTEQAARIEVLETVLRFYADPESWQDFIMRPAGRDSYFHSAPAKLDMGLLARQALTQHPTRSEEDLSSRADGAATRDHSLAAPDAEGQ